MTFGQKIKELRRREEMTQENLAELLSISPQAVSRWETEMAMPDISLLPPLANLFGVTTDYLLGMDTYQKDLRKAEFEEAFYEYWKRDDKEKNYRIAVRAAAEYPGNMEYVEWLASAEYYVGVPCTDNLERIQLLESSAKHYRIVLANSTDRKLYEKALYGIVLTLCDLGKKQEAKEYALELEDEQLRDDALIWCLEGKEKIVQGQKVAESLLCRFVSSLNFVGNTVAKCEAIEKILAILFPDGNYQYYHSFLQYNAIEKAIALCDEKQYDAVITELGKARLHAEELVKFSKETKYGYTSPLFCHVQGEKSATDSDVTDLDDFIDCLQNNRCFDPIREQEAFQRLLAKTN